MKTRLKVWIISAIFISTVICFNEVIACSMIKITLNGKTIIGNNEDFSNPDTRIWFEPGSDGNFGAAYVGYDYLFPEGGMNEAGLVFDAFGVANKPVKDTFGKEPIFQNELKRLIMQKCTTVEEVKELIDKYNIYFWSHAVWVFIDRMGKYLVVEGDNRIIGNNSMFVQTNFRQFEITDTSQITCWRYKKAESLLKKHAEVNIDYCTSVMDSIHTGGTQYTTVYEPDKGLIHLYYFHNYNKSITFDLNEELKKGWRILSIPELFPDEKTKTYVQYRQIKSTIDLLLISDSANDTLKSANIKNQLKKIEPISHILGNYGYELLNENKVSDAIAVFKLYVEFFPQSPEGYDYLGEAYMQDKKYQLAVSNYSYSLELNPDNINGRQRIERIKNIFQK